MGKQVGEERRRLPPEALDRTPGILGLGRVDADEADVVAAGHDERVAVDHPVDGGVEAEGELDHRRRRAWGTEPPAGAGRSRRLPPDSARTARHAGSGWGGRVVSEAMGASPSGGCTGEATAPAGDATIAAVAPQAAVRRVARAPLGGGGAAKRRPGLLQAPAPDLTGMVVEAPRRCSVGHGAGEVARSWLEPWQEGETTKQRAVAEPKHGRNQQWLGWAARTRASSRRSAVTIMGTGHTLRC